MITSDPSDCDREDDHPEFVDDYYGDEEGDEQIEANGPRMGAACVNPPHTYGECETVEMHEAHHKRRNP